MRFSGTMRYLVHTVVAALLASAIQTATSPASTEQPETALAAFRENLRNPADQRAFDALSEEELQTLERYLRGSLDFDHFGGVEASTGAAGFEFRSAEMSSLSRGSLADAPSATTYTKTVSAWQTFLFAGIEISRSTVRVTYTVSGGVARAISTYSCYATTADPFAQVTSTKDGAWVASGRATAECLVSVRRGAPTPWGQWTWSTKEAVQFVTGNGSGYVTSHGWR